MRRKAAMLDRRSQKIAAFKGIDFLKPGVFVSSWPDPISSSEKIAILFLPIKPYSHGNRLPGHFHTMAHFLCRHRNGIRAGIPYSEKCRDPDIFQYFHPEPMSLLEILATAASLFTSLAAFIVSIVALRLASKTYLHSSKDYVPEADFKIKADGTIEVTNKSNDLFKIQMLNLLEVKQVGFEDKASQSLKQIKLITKSLAYRWLQKQGRKRKIKISLNTPGPCAYNRCPYDQNLVRDLENLLYSMDPDKAYALPSLQSILYVVEFLYSNKFQEIKSAIFVYEHYHGYGYEKRMISGTDINRLLIETDVPHFDNAEGLLDYIAKRNSSKGRS